MADDPSYGPGIHPRIKTQAQVSIARADPPDVAAETIDLSLSGVLFQCAALGVEVNDLVQVTLQIGDDEISLLGRLVRIRDVDAYAQELAVTFVNMDESRFALLQEFLEDVAPL